jgi:Ca-activated chloride channel homolog
MGCHSSRRGLVLLIFVLLITASIASAQFTEVAAFEERKDSADIESTGITITKRVDEVNLIFTVTDSKGHFVSALPSDAFQLLDNHQPPRAMGYFHPQTNLPLRVGLLIDESDSIRGRFKFEQKGASLFLKKILRPDVDQAFVVGFDGTVNLAADMTGNIEQLAKGIHSLKSEGETSLYDAVIFACDKLRQQGESRVTRRAIILISDGVDTKSKAILRDAEEAAARSDVVIYALSTNNLEETRHPKGDAVMDLLTEPTGGHILPAREEDDLKHAFVEIEKALRSQYAVGYHPADFTPDGSFRSIQIMARKKGLKVQCRKGYFAPVD